MGRTDRNGEGRPTFPAGATTCLRRNESVYPRCAVAARLAAVLFVVSLVLPFGVGAQGSDGADGLAAPRTAPRSTPRTDAPDVDTSRTAPSPPDVRWPTATPAPDVRWPTAVSPGPMLAPGIGRHRLHVRVEGYDRLSLYELGIDGRGRADRHVATPLCEAPCELAIDDGLHAFGMARPGERVRVPDHSVLDLRGDAELRLIFVDRSDLRVAGHVVFFVGFPIGAAMILTGLFGFGGFALIIPGAILAAFSLVFWFVAAFHNDTADLRIEPFTVRF